MTSDEPTRRLAEAIEAFAAGCAPELVAEARAAAVAKARTILTDALAESLLANSAELLDPTAKSQRPSVERPTRTARGRKRAPKRARPEAAGRASPRASRSATRAGARGPAPATDVEAEIGHYVYGVSFAPAALPEDLEGVDPRFPVAFVQEQDLAAIVSRVSLAEFGEERLRENLNDVAWLEEKARAHENVLDAALQLSTVVPMRLCTIYSGEEQVREMLHGEREVLLDALGRLEGKAEWGVKLIAEPGALERVVGERSAADDGGEREATRGTAYMNRKRRLARSREEELQLAEEWAREVHDELAGAAREALLNPLQRPDVSGYEGEMLLNGVYLVEDGRLEEFRSLVEHLAGEYRSLGVAVELTGPWPPYNFVKSSIEAAR